MQQVRALLCRQAPRAVSRFAVSGYAPITAASSRVLALAPRLPSSARLFASEATAYSQPTEETDEYVPTPFASYSNINPKTMQAIEQVMRFKTASKVQDQVISRMPLERDIMVKAKTGTGKTMAFLVPAMELLAAEYANNPERARKGREVGCMIISPTRELAKQIAVEAEKLVKFHRWNVQLLVGGESSRNQLRNLGFRRSDIVIGTPGRLLDFLQNQPTFAQQFKSGKVLVLDEADVLLEMGFRKELEQLVSCMPKERKTLLVSATLGRNVKELASTVFSGGFDLIDCVGQEDTNTHANVKQEYIPVPFSHQVPVMCDLIGAHAAKNNAEGRGSKIIIFLPTIKATNLYAEVLKSMVGMRRGREGSVDVIALHGGIAQASRSNRSDRFRSASLRAGNMSILVTTDVSARGVDYPDVSMVIQVGIPSATEAYIHRLGRTGRAGKSGEGVIMLSPVEMPFLRELRDVQITKSEKYTPVYMDSLSDFENGPLKHLSQRWNDMTSSIDEEILSSAYISLLAFYSAHATMIGKPSIQNIIDDAQDIMVPFKLPPPEISSRMKENLGMNRSSNRSRGGRGGQSFGNRGDRSFGDRGGRGFGDRGDRSFGDRGGRSFGDRGGRSFGDRGDRSFGGRDNKSFGDRSFGSRDNKSFGSRGDRSFGSRDNKSFGSRGDRSFGSRDNKSFGSRGDRSFGDRGMGFGE
ncbi:hypothetical protein IW148_004780 [Coemansia sp. RSA 1199]|nr:hypothetical protein IW148_004780 [Coemansia sp. RSA 1199]